jgi:electron transfer flavoprotein-quinone oxidoreductase
MADDFDAIVVGAGMAGSAAAIRLAQGGANVLLAERGAEAGVKNLSGGVLWGHDLDRILPNWWQEMPVERHLVRKRFGLMTADRSLVFEYSEAEWTRAPYVAHTVLRARTDAWLAKKAEEAGATVVTSVPVERLNWEGATVHGIVQGGEKMTAPVTIVADGTNSRLTLGTPIRPDPRFSGESTELGIKEVFRLSESQINERFSLGPQEAHAEEWLAGFLPNGVMGGGFLYTNRDTISVGIILNIASLSGQRVRSEELMERFKLHPAIAPRLQGAELVEYGAKLIPGGWASRPTAFDGAGWMVAGDSAGFVFSNGIMIQGMNYAIRSGIEAAETALAAKKAGSGSAAQLSEYTRRLASTHILSDFRDFARMDHLKWNPRLYQTYPAFATELFHRLMSESGGPKRPIRAHVEGARRKSKASLYNLAMDGFSLLRDF